MSSCLWPYGLESARLLCPWDSPGKNTGVGCHAFLQGIFPTQPGIEPISPAAPVLQADSLPGKPINNNSIISITKSLFNIISNHEEDEVPGKYKDQQVIVCRDYKNSVPKREMSKTSVPFPQWLRVVPALLHHTSLWQIIWPKALKWWRRPLWDGWLGQWGHPLGPTCSDLSWEADTNAPLFCVHHRQSQWPISRCPVPHLPAR